MKKFLKKHYKIILIILAALIASSLLVVILLDRKPTDTQTENNKNKSLVERVQDLGQKEKCTSNPNPVFTHPFTDLSKIASIGPIGTLTGGSPGRSYIQINDSVTTEVPVYLPTDATLERLVYARRGGENTPGEYGLQFRASCEVTFMLDHIDRVTEEIQKMAPKEPDTKSNGGTNPMIEIKAGTLLGYSDGTPQAKIWDFFVLNSANPPKFINPKRWTWDQAVTAVCPYDFYTEDLKNQHYKLLGVGGGKYTFTKADSCGSPSKDVASTIAGGWFQGEDSTDSKSRSLNVGSHVGIPQFNIKENGNKTINFSDWNNKKLPETVKVGESVCYTDGQSKWAYLKLESESKLLAATGDGSCPTIFPLEKAEIWER